MDQMKFHKQKLFAIIAAVLGFISCFLPWWNVGFAGLGVSVSGLRDLGILVFLAFIAAGVLTIISGDRTKAFDDSSRLYTGICFGVAAVFTIIQMFKTNEFTTNGAGIWLSLLCGAAGVFITLLLRPAFFEAKSTS